MKKRKKRKTERAKQAKKVKVKAENLRHENGVAQHPPEAHVVQELDLSTTKKEGGGGERLSHSDLCCSATSRQTMPKETHLAQTYWPFRFNATIMVKTM